METTANRSSIEYGVADRPLPGQAESGDRYLVKALRHGVLVAAVDGLGHGNDAAEAARMAVNVLERHAEESLISLFQRCHDSLRETRGVVMSVALLNRLEGTITWLGVGNVEGRLLRADRKAKPNSESLFLRPGVVGSQLPPLHLSVIPVKPQDMLVLATDGVQSDFADRLTASGSPQRMAERILAEHNKRNDDALVLVVRCLG